MTPDANKCGVAYKSKCGSDTYVGETSRSLGNRFKEHAKLKAPLTAIGEHAVNGSQLAELKKSIHSSHATAMKL